MPLQVFAVSVAAKQRRNTSKLNKSIESFLITALFLFFISSDYGPTHINNNVNYPYNGAENSPTSYDNKIHVSEIYGNCKLNILKSLHFLLNNYIYLSSFRC